MPATKEELDVVLRILDDARGLIASLKVQRWEVAKWGATLNIALAAASVGFKRSPAAFFLFTFGIAILSIILLFYYNRRLTKARERLPPIHRFIRNNVIDLKQKVGLEYGMAKGSDYDWQEMYLFPFIVFLSALPAFVIWQSNFWQY